MILVFFQIMMTEFVDDGLHDNFILLPPNLPIVKEKTFKDFVEKYANVKD